MPDNPTPLTRQQRRAMHILDAAADLILRWGYDKTTIDDISRKAGVAKGTIYLHWKTREDLFQALLQREKAEAYDDIQRRIRQDPEGWTLRAIVKHSALATLKRPLLKALFVGDRAILGKLAGSEMGSSAYTDRLTGFKAYLEVLRLHDLVRTDLSLNEEMYIWSTALTGIFFAAPLLPPELSLSDEAQAELVSEMVHRALETDREVSPAEYQAVADAFNHYLQSTAAGGAGESLEEAK